MIIDVSLTSCVYSSCLKSLTDTCDPVLHKDGNGCTLFTTNPVSAQAFHRGVNVGQIGINVPILGKSEVNERGVA